MSNNYGCNFGCHDNDGSNEQPNEMEACDTIRLTCKPHCCGSSGITGPTGPTGPTGATGSTPPCIYAKPNKPLCLQANAKLHRKKGTL